jgi:molybdate transport system substrate-binding protein
MTRRVALLILPIALAAGCWSDTPTPAPTPPPGPAGATEPTPSQPRDATSTSKEPLRAAAASDLQAVLPVLAARFKADTGIEVEPVFGASGQLAQQIKAGAPFDLFLSANRKFVDDLAGAGVIRPDSVRPYTRGVLVLVVNTLVDPGVKGLADVAGEKVKTVAIANPEIAPYGAAAKQALERAGLWEKVKPKLAQSESVRQALQYVQSGNAEVGFVGKAIADVKGIRTIPLPPDAYDQIVQALGVVKDSKRADDAERFAKFLLGEVGQGIFRDFGFRSVGESP